MTAARVCTLPGTALAGLLLCVFSLTPLPASAQDAPIATASGGQAKDAKPEAVLAIPDAWTTRPDEEEIAAQEDRRPHGMVEVGVGTNGYRGAAGVVTAPIGKTGQVTVAVEKTEGRVRWR